MKSCTSLTSLTKNLLPVRDPVLAELTPSQHRYAVNEDQLDSVINDAGF